MILPISSEIELFRSNPEEESILTSSKFIACRKDLMRVHDVILSDFCIFGFFPFLYAYINKRYKPVVYDFINKKHPYSLINRKDRNITFIFPGIGAPLAGCLLDETIDLGASCFIVIGSAGVLQNEIKHNELIIPTAAIRDEGTSFHYERPSRYSFPDQDLVQIITDHLSSLKIPYRKGITWTTDGLYRETPSKIKRLHQEGCISVDMETSALFSIAKYYQKKIAYILIPTDDVTDEHWIPRTERRKRSGVTPEVLFEIAADVFDQLMGL